MSPELHWQNIFANQRSGNRFANWWSRKNVFSVQVSLRMLFHWQWPIPGLFLYFRLFHKQFTANNLSLKGLDFEPGPIRVTVTEATTLSTVPQPVPQNDFSVYLCFYFVSIANVQWPFCLSSLINRNKFWNNFWRLQWQTDIDDDNDEDQNQSLCRQI